jgi:hypothetical protein
MDCLPFDVVQQLGTCLDEHDKRKCLEASKAFKSVNYLDTYHQMCVNNDNIREKLSRLGDTLNWVKTIKPHLEQFDIEFVDIKELDMFVDERCINTSNIEIIVRISSSVVCVKELLQVLSKIDVITHLYIHLSDYHDTVDVQLFGKNIENIYVDMSSKHCFMLEYEAFARRIRNLKMMIYVTDQESPLYISPLYICLDHIHPSCESLNICTNTPYITISAPHKITHFSGLNEFYEHDIMGFLLSCFSNSLSMHLSKMQYVNIRDTSVLWSASQNNFWYQLSKILPKTVQYYVETYNENHYMTFIQTLCRDLGCQVHLMVWDTHTHIAAKVMSMLENVQIIFVCNYNGDEEIDEAQNIHDLWNLMDDYTKTCWNWLRYVK